MQAAPGGLPQQELLMRRKGNTLSNQLASFLGGRRGSVDQRSKKVLDQEVASSTFHFTNQAQRQSIYEHLAHFSARNSYSLFKTQLKYCLRKSWECVYLCVPRAQHGAWHREAHMVGKSHLACKDGPCSLTSSRSHYPPWKGGSLTQTSERVSFP